MNSVLEHYDAHLGPIYSWMLGDLDAAMARSRDELRGLGLRPAGTGLAVDLGAGPGLHALALCELGFSVVALEASAPLAAELRGRAAGSPVRVVEADLSDFGAHLAGPADVVLCMGDTLTHLRSHAAVQQLLADVAARLAPGGTFVATFRDYRSRMPTGAERFIPVRADAQRILTCFLEYGEDVVTVHDLVHERGPGGWALRVSSYPKLRLAPREVADALADQGLAVRCDAAPGGMTRVVARR